ncbi:MAG: hypothetical protein EpisKO_00470 [Epibacterium sp.]
MSSKPLHLPLAAEQWTQPLRWSRLDDVCEGVFDCPHTTPKLTGDGPFVVRSQDIRGRVFDYRNAGHVSENTYVTRIARAEPRFGDLLYSREGTYFGIAAEVPREHRVCLGQRMVLIRPDRLELDHRFLLYWLNSPVMEGHLGGFRDGSVAERLNMATIRALPVPILPIEVQREIAAVLGALDDKIELNRKTAATLEEMARALYRSWFVDFDPVHAKSEGRAPAHMDEATADLFPDSFGEDGLPEGWSSGSLGDLIEFNPREKIAKGSNTPYLDMKALPTTGMIADPAYQRPFTSGTKFRVGDTLLARITPCLENGKTAMVDDLLGSEVGWGSTEFIVMRGRPGVPSSLPYCVARDPSFREEAIATMTGSSGRQRADAVRISQLDCAVPPIPLLSAFSEASDPMIRRIHALGKENQTLAALRDTLLPRLMSGELRVGKAHEQVEAAQ